MRPETLKLSSALRVLSTYPPLGAWIHHRVQYAIEEFAKNVSPSSMSLDIVVRAANLFVHAVYLNK